MFFLNCFLIMALSLTLYSADETLSIILPGQNGLGGEKHYYKSIGISNGEVFRCKTVGGFFKIDLGQGNCIRDFHAQLPDTRGKKNIILSAISQGTATIINGYDDLPPDIKSKVKCITLEAVLGSGNSAIFHTIQGPWSPCSFITYAPFSRYWLPILAKCAYPTYNPWGKQLLSSAKKLPRELPIIIMHDQNDPQLSINDARQLYCTLKKGGNSNVYLIETCLYANIPQHIDIIEFDQYADQKKSVIQEIYRRHGLPVNQELLHLSNDPDLTEFQPSIETVRERIK